MAQNTNVFAVRMADNMGIVSTRYFRFDAWDPAAAETQRQASIEERLSRLHAQVLRLIDNQRRVDPESLPRTMAVYDHLHKRDIDQVAEIGVLQMQYKSK